MVSVVLDPNSLKYTAICTTLLGFKIVAVMFGMGSSRVAAGCRPPEDIVLFPKNGPQSFDGSCRADKSDNPKHQQRAETEIRWARIMANDLENIPIGLFMIFLSLLCGSSKSVHLYLTTIFTVARIAHTFFFANKLAKFRSISWAVGVICFLGLGINSIVGASAN